MLFGTFDNLGSTILEIPIGVMKFWNWRLLKSDRAMLIIHLEEFLKTMKISGSGNQNALDETDKNVVASAEHLLSLAEGKTKKFSGGKSTYKDVLDAFEAIKKSDYDFEQAPAAIAPPQNANNASPNSTSNSNKPTPKKQQPPVANQQPPMTNGLIL